MADEIDLSKNPTIMEMTKMMKGLAAIVQQQTSTISNLNANISNLTATGGKSKAKAEEEEEEVDPEKLSNKQFQELILGKVGTLLDDKLKGVLDRVEGTSRDLNRFRIGEEAKALMAKHKDFGDWNDEMAALAKVHPTLDLGSLYKLARLGDDSKAKELDTKYAPKDEGKPSEKLKIFGGFKPSKTGDGDSSGNKEEKKMTTDEALEAAWNEAVEAAPMLAQTGDDGAN
jgi:hypothetical protein